jgi:hypothetical protein
MRHEGEMQDPDHPIVYFDTLHNPDAENPDAWLSEVPEELGFLLPLHGGIVRERV